MGRIVSMVSCEQGLWLSVTKGVVVSYRGERGGGSGMSLIFLVHVTVGPQLVKRSYINNEIWMNVNKL